MNKDMMPAHWTEDGPYGTSVSLKPAPIAWISRSSKNGDLLHWSKAQALHYSSDIYPLYGTPQKREWQGLTDDERGAIMRQFGVWTFSNEWLACLEVEAKLKEKNSAP